MIEHIFKTRKWTVEQEEWLIAHATIRGKNQMWEAFKEAFPDSNYTVAAISSKRTELGAYAFKKKGGKAPRPLYSEQIKKGYVRIKVAKNEWWQKQKWVWVATHPGEPFEKSDLFIFLDCNNRNFSPDNIFKVTHKDYGTVNRKMGGFIPGQPDFNRFLIIYCRHLMALYDLGEKLGLVTNYGAGRCFYSDRSEWQRKAYRNRTPEQKEHYRQWRKEYEARKKTPEQKARIREYKKEWARRKRNEISV